MNSLYNLALRQSSSLQTDLSAITPPATPAQLGQLAASLAALGRTVDEYEAMARRELVPAKREKALGRVEKLREEERAFRGEMGRVKEAVSAAARARSGAPDNGAWGKRAAAG
jgi:Golgi SNAP receptor complex protein 2